MTPLLDHDRLVLSGDPERPLTLTDATARQERIAALLAARNGQEG